MTNRLVLIAALTVAAGLAPAHAQAPAAADTILVNGKVITLDDASSIVQAVAQAAEVQGVARVSMDGSRAYFVAQGVLTTMKLTQIKWIGLAALATSLSAGSVVAVAYAAAPTQATAKPGDRLMVMVSMRV